MYMNIYIVYYFVQYMGEKAQTSMILQSSAEDDFKADKGCTLYKSATEHASIIHMVNLLYISIISGQGNNNNNHILLRNAIYEA